METLVQEAIRRAAALGLSGFVLTEEALRRAFADTVPREWVDYASSQGSQVRRELLDRISAEFGSWLRELDPEALQRAVLDTLLREYDFELRIEISARPRRGAQAASLSLARKRK